MDSYQDSISASMNEMCKATWVLLPTSATRPTGPLQAITHHHRPNLLPCRGIPRCYATSLASGIEGALPDALNPAAVRAFLFRPRREHFKRRVKAFPTLLLLKSIRPEQHLFTRLISAAVCATKRSASPPIRSAMLTLSGRRARRLFRWSVLFNQFVRKTATAFLWLR